MEENRIDADTFVRCLQYIANAKGLCLSDLDISVSNGSYLVDRRIGSKDGIITTSRVAIIYSKQQIISFREEIRFQDMPSNLIPGSTRFTDISKD